jgi:hypothetical protein
MDQTAFAVNDDLAYGFAAARIGGQDVTTTCCRCYMLKFDDGKKFVAQITNTGVDLEENHFDLGIAGGGMGLFDKQCPAQFPGFNGGARYGGTETDDACSQLPKQMQAGCRFRYKFFKDGTPGGATFEEVTCPKELVAITGCSVDQ